MIDLSFVQNKCVPYWPDSQEPKEVGQYVVTVNSEREASDYKVRILKMCPAQQVTLASRSALSDVHLRDFNFCRLFHSRKIPVSSGTTSTPSGPTTASPRSPVAS